MKPFFYLLILIVLQSSSCQGPEKLLEKQKYDLLLKRVGKLAKRKKTVSYEWVKATEEAFAKSNERDKAFIKRKEEEGGIAGWKAVYYAAKKMDYRQEQLRKSLPIE